VKLLIEHVIAGITPAAYETLHFDEAFNTALGVELGLGRTLVRLDRTATRIVRHVRCTPRRAASSDAAQVLDDRAAFVEELDYEIGQLRGTWRTIPSVFADRVRSSGTLELAAVPGGTRRIVRGEVTVALFGLGRLVERKIIAEMEKTYAGAARFAEAWLVRGEPPRGGPAGR
jgi:hypothetical protein